MYNESMARIRTTKQAARLRTAVLEGLTTANQEWHNWENGDIGEKPTFTTPTAEHVYKKQHRKLLCQWTCTP